MPAAAEDVVYTLSCEELRLSVEFALGRGEFGRIGSSPEVEISLPLVGFSEVECRISLDEGGMLWLIREDRELPVRIDPPSYFHAGPYRFLIREKVEELVQTTHITTTEPSAPSDEKKDPTKKQPKISFEAMLMIAIPVALVCLGGAAWLANHQSSRTLESEKQVQITSPPVEDEPKSPKPIPATIEPKNGPARTPDPQSSPNMQPPVVPQVTGNPAPAQEPDRMDLEKLATSVVPCVFLIEVFDGSGTSIGKGTGFSVSADGLVATNRHVIEDGLTYSLVTSQGAKFDKAEVVVSDPDTDLALLKIEARELPYLPLAESSKVPIGKRVAVYGSPLGLVGSLSEGIVSASERNLTESHPDEELPNNGTLIQTTAPISPGSSGSPLFDAQGKVIGVMTLTLKRNSQSLNFAVPVEALKLLLDRATSSWSVAKPGGQTSRVERSAASAKIDAKVQSDPAYRQLWRLMIARDWVESLKVARTLADRYPNSSLAHFQYGYCAAMLKLYHQAELSFTKAIELDPRNPRNHEAWNNLGIALDNQNQPQGALLAYEKAASLKPDFPAAWDNIVRTNVALGNWAKATTALDTLLQIDLKRAGECARMLAKFNIPDAGFREALKRALARDVGKVSFNGHQKFRVVGVSPNDPLAVRSGPGVGFPRIIALQNGMEVIVTGAGRMNGSTQWLPIIYENSSGWVVSKYLRALE
jgi:S1-C subfamily serine protease